MRRLVLITLLVLVVSGVSAAEPVRIESFPVGIYGDDARAVTCVAGPPGTVFQQVAWVYVPDDLGLAYVTLRFDFPTNVDLTSRPVFHDLVNNVVFTDFVDGTVEWNMLFDDCPSGWIKIFTQDCVILDDEMSLIRVVGNHSLVRDCTFVLNDVNVLNQLSINDPDCQNVAAIPTGWGGVKCRYR